MSIRSRAELRKLRIIGSIVRKILDEMANAVRPGISTAQLDAICATALVRYEAESAPQKVYGFPGAACISVNDEAVHGIPGARVLAEGDLVKLDVTAEKNGFVADAAITVPVGQISALAQSLARCAKVAFQRALTVARAGNYVCEIGRVVEQEAKRCGFRVVRELCGHGVGRSIHEKPLVPNYYDPRLHTRLTEGLVITIEPIIVAGNGRVQLLDDRWTMRTYDGSLAAHHEHTLVITRGKPMLLTAASMGAG